MPHDPIFDTEPGMNQLLEVMRRLRDPKTGCPWDIEQTFQTIAPYTIEEAYEVADAIEREDWDDLKGELGDLLLQTVYHTSISADAGLYDFHDVAENIASKMIARHPHVFGAEDRNKSAEQQTRDWETIKAAERAGKSQNGTLDGVALGLPALLRAVKLQKRAARVGFDWPNTDDVISKLIEEAQEVVEAREQADFDALEEEVGDLLFVMANLARHLGVDPEQALRKANGKFTRRFNHIEATLSAQGKCLTDTTLEEMDEIWNEAKHLEKQ